MTPLAIALVLLLQTVDGLRAGESAGPAASALGSNDCVRGRVLDGCNGQPIEGAEVELFNAVWSSADQALARGATRVDGSFCIAPQTPAKFVRIRASGHRGTTIAVGETCEVLVLPLTHSLGLRAIDLEGKSIAGARVRSRQINAHAPVACEAVSDADGRFDLSSFPPLADHSGFVVDAPGHGAVFLPDVHGLLLPGGLDVRLPRRKPIAFQVVDASGKTLVHRRVSLGDEADWFAGATDENGRVQFDSPFFDRDVHLAIEDGGDFRELASGGVRDGFEPRIVYPSSAAAARAQLESSGPPTSVAELQILHVPRLSQHTLLHVQVGDDSITLLDPEQPLSLSVSAGGPLVVCAVDDDTTRIARAPRVEGHPTIDLSQASSVISTRREPGPLTHVRFVALDHANLRVELETAWGGLGELRLSDEVDIDASAAFEGRLLAEARVARCFGPWFASIDSGNPIEVALARRGSLEVCGPLTALVAGGVAASPQENGALRVADLAPGPLLAQLVLRDGRVLELSLVLGDGEERVLTLH